MTEQLNPHAEESAARLIRLTPGEVEGATGFDAIVFAKNSLAFQIYRPELQTPEVQAQYPLFTPVVAATLAMRAGDMPLPRIRRILGDDAEAGEDVYTGQRWNQPIPAARAVMRAFEIGLFRRIESQRHDVRVVGKNSKAALKATASGLFSMFDARIPVALDQLAEQYDTDDLPALVAQVYSTLETPRGVNPGIQHLTDMGYTPRAVATHNRSTGYSPDTDLRQYWQQALAGFRTPSPRQRPAPEARKRWAVIEPADGQEPTPLPPPVEEGREVRWGRGVFIDNIPRAGISDERTKELRARMLKLSCFDMTLSQIETQMLPDTPPNDRVLIQARTTLDLPGTLHGSVRELFLRDMIQVETPLEVPNVELDSNYRKLLALLLTDKPNREIAATFQSTIRTNEKRIGQLMRAFGVSTRHGLITIAFGSKLVETVLKDHIVGTGQPQHQE